MAAAKPAPVAAPLPQAPDRFDRSNEQQTRHAIEQAFQRCIASQPAVSITGATADEKVDSLIAALVSLGYVTDDTT